MNSGLCVNDADLQPFAITASIIVPVYNKESSLEACLDSLYEQTIDKSLLEIILINDGSTDGSKEICLAAKRKYSFINYIEQTNQGVSAARNAGLKAARGKYILFLDADDTLSSFSVKNVTDFFEETSSEVDLVTYPLEYIYPKTGATGRHKREEWLTSSGIYELDKTPYIVQGTMNTCIKNEGSKTPLFNTSLKMGEDQLFNTKILSKKSKIGFCKEAQYNYTRGDNNSSHLGDNPLYAYDDMIYLYESFMALTDKYPTSGKYVFQLLIYNLNWRLKKNILFPAFFTGQESSLQTERLLSILRRIPLNEYCDSPYLNYFFKSFLLGKAGYFDKIERIEYFPKKNLVYFDGGDILKTSKANIILSHLLCEKKQLLIRGRLVGPTFICDKQPRLFLTTANSNREITLGSSSYDYKFAHLKTTKTYSFELNIPLKEAKSPTEFSFKLQTKSSKVPHLALKPILMKHNARIVLDDLSFPHATLTIQSNSFTLKKNCLKENVTQARLLHSENPSLYSRRKKISRVESENHFQKICLYSDKPFCTTNKDNALVQILHDLNKKDGIRRYYATSIKEEVAKRHPELKNHILEFNSEHHIQYFLRASVVVTSQFEHSKHNPLSKEDYEALGDLYKLKKCIYLQEGVFNAHRPWSLSYDRGRFDHIAISTYSEIDNLTKNYEYPADALIPSGMPYFDSISKCSSNPRKILFAPSWRSHHIENTSGTLTLRDSTFLNSQFYKESVHLIEGITSNKLFDELGYCLEIKLHPNFKCCSCFFDNIHESVSVVEEAAPENYSVVLSDWSSYVFDFVYAGTNIIYFVPDYQEFKAGLNYYSSLNLPLEKGFGTLCLNHKEALSELESILLEKESTETQTIRRAPSEPFFLHRDNKNCERFYNEYMRRLR